MVVMAFDVYGTLIDTAGITKALEKYMGNQASDFSRIWREKQLEYSFRRGLMQKYQNFAVCTKNALDYACLIFHAEVKETEKKKLMAAYKILPAFPDVDDGLSRLKTSGFRMFAFSNGLAQDVMGLLKNAKIGDYFEDIVSVDEVRSFKPDPAVYNHFLRRSGSSGSQAWLISSNPFDVIGAIASGMRAAWVRRSPNAMFDPWEIKPTITVSSLRELGEAMNTLGNQSAHNA